MEGRKVSKNLIFDQILEAAKLLASKSLQRNLLTNKDTVFKFDFATAAQICRILKTVLTQVL